ncbi:MAG: hypothetical protein AAB588_06520 [Patescibacteria group bacterium]
MASKDFPYVVSTSPSGSLSEKSEFCHTSNPESVRSFAEQAEIVAAERLCQAISLRLNTDPEFRTAVILFLTLHIQEGSHGFKALTGMGLSPILSWCTNKQSGNTKRIWHEIEIEKVEAIARNIEKACSELLKRVEDE